MFRNYLKTTLRNLRNNRAYAILNILGLSIGMSGAILIFLFLQHHRSTDRHQPHFDRVYRVVLDLILDEVIEHGTDSSVPFAASLGQNYPQIEKAGFIRKQPNATLSAGTGAEIKRFIEKDNVVFANSEFMEMFAFEWLGIDASALMKEPYWVVISEKIARKYFGSSDVTGRMLTLSNTHQLKIAGVVKDPVAPTDLAFDVFLSLPTLKRVEPSYEMDNFGWLSARNTSFVRLKEGVSARQTEELIRNNGEHYYGEIAKHYHHKLQPMSEVHFDERYGGKIRKPILWILAAVGIFLVLIACINFVNLSTAQALKRTKEIGLRKVLGGTRGQLFWQFISETTLLTMVSAVLALWWVVMLLPVLNDWMYTHLFHIGMLFQIPLFVFWMVAILFVVFCAGFYPAVIVSGFNPIGALKGRGYTRKTGEIGLRRSLIAVQLIIAQVLTICTFVLILQLKYFKNADLGFDQKAVITIPLPAINPAPSLKNGIKNSLLQYPDISSVTYQYAAPTSSMGYGGSVRFDNRLDWEKFIIRERFGDEDYLTTYKMSLLAGRNFTAREPDTAFIVNEELMHKLGISDPEEMLGRQLEDGNTSAKGEIVGVVKQFHLKSLQEPVEPCVVFAHPRLYKELAIRLNTNDFSRTLGVVREVWKEFYPNEVFSYEFVDDQIAGFYEKEAQLTALIRVFAVVAILICCLGLYGMVSFILTQRTKEIGIRKVLGAGVSSIVFLFGKEFMMIVMIAFVVAVPVAWYAMSSWLNDFAYRIDLSWWMFAAAGIVALIIVMFTVSFQVTKAALVNPVRSIRVE